MKYITLLLLTLLIPIMIYAEGESFDMTDDTNDIALDTLSGNMQSNLGDPAYLDILNFNYALEHDVLIVQFTTVGDIPISIPNFDIDMIDYNLAFYASWDCFIDACESSGYYIHYWINQTGNYFEASDNNGIIMLSKDQDEHFQLNNNSFTFTSTLQSDQEVAFLQARQDASYFYSISSGLAKVNGDWFHDESSYYYQGSDYSVTYSPFSLVYTLVGMIGIYFTQKRK